MTACSLLAARTSIAAAVMALSVLAALHVLKPDVRAGSTMISQYALGRYGQLMAVCFAMFGVASACLPLAIGMRIQSVSSRVGMVFLLLAAIGFVMAACFPMDAVSTPPKLMSLSGKIHGPSFAVTVPSQLLAVLCLSFAFVQFSWRMAVSLLGLTLIMWLSMATVIAIMLIVGPGKPPDPTGPERFLGWPNRLSLIAYGAWLCLAAWPAAR